MAQHAGHLRIPNNRHHIGDRPEHGRRNARARCDLEDKADVGLTIGEYKIVQLLASNAGSYVTYCAIYDRMTYEGFIAGVGNIGHQPNVRSAIRRIGNKFRECDPVFVEIENYVGFGYCWGRQVDEGDPKGSKRRSDVSCPLEGGED
jgi:hypothetical protein